LHLEFRHAIALALRMQAQRTCQVNARAHHLHAGEGRIHGRPWALNARPEKRSLCRTRVHPPYLATRNKNYFPGCWPVSRPPGQAEFRDWAVYRRRAKTLEAGFSTTSGRRRKLMRGIQLENRASFPTAKQSFSVAILLSAAPAPPQPSSHCADDSRSRRADSSNPAAPPKPKTKPTVPLQTLSSNDCTLVHGTLRRGKSGAIHRSATGESAAHHR